MNQEEAQRLNFESRKETLLALMRRYIEQLEKIDPYDAVVMSSMVADFLLTNIDIVQIKIGQNESDRLINECFKSDS